MLEYNLICPIERQKVQLLIFNVYYCDVLLLKVVRCKFFV